MLNKPSDVAYCGVDPKVIKKAKPELDYDALGLFYRYIINRYNVHLRKDVLQKSPPWTTDPILLKYRFTNVRREHDRETKWVIDHIASNPELCYEDKLLNTILFRLYNKHETAELISMPIPFSEYNEGWDPGAYEELFKAAKKSCPDRVFFTGAFSTSGMKRCMSEYIPKGVKCSITEMRMLHFIAYLINTGYVKRLLSKSIHNQQDCFYVIQSMVGIGTFLAYQIFVDFTYIDEFPFSENEFVVCGPGCKEGLKYLFKLTGGMSLEETIFWLRDNIDRLFKEDLGKCWDPKKIFWDIPLYDRSMNVMSIENCLCEFSKYMKIITKAGRPRKKYIYRGN